MPALTSPAWLRSDASAVLIAVGANVAGRFGSPEETIACAVALLRAELKVSRTSPIYKTAPVGGGRQPGYLNAVLSARFDGGSARLLLVLKRIERRAGRRLGRHWGPRALDLDIIDHGGKRLGFARAVRRAPLVLPHPLAHRRAFVLIPLAVVEPWWRHPVLGITSRELLHRIGPSDRKQVREWRAFHSTCPSPTCYESPTQKD